MKQRQRQYKNDQKITNDRGKSDGIPFAVSGIFRRRVNQKKKGDEFESLIGIKTCAHKKRG